MENKTRVPIVCDGKEISYGVMLSHLFKYDENDTFIHSKMYDKLEPVLYSAGAFKHDNNRDNPFCVFVGNGSLGRISTKKIFEKFGIFIGTCNDGIVAIVKDTFFHEGNYGDFLQYANTRCKEYIALENEYYNGVNNLNSQWILSSFNEMQATPGPFQKNKNEKLVAQQLYDCAAFVIYLDLLKSI